MAACASKGGCPSDYIALSAALLSMILLVFCKHFFLFCSSQIGLAGCGYCEVKYLWFVFSLLYHWWLCNLGKIERHYFFSLWYCDNSAEFKENWILLKTISLLSQYGWQKMENIKLWNKKQDISPFWLISLIWGVCVCEGNWQMGLLCVHKIYLLITRSMKWGLEDCTPLELALRLFGLLSPVFFPL